LGLPSPRVVTGLITAYMPRLSRPWMYERSARPVVCRRVAAVPGPGVVRIVRWEIRRVRASSSVMKEAPRAVQVRATPHVRGGS
jgi:hypothetical protein